MSAAFNSIRRHQAATVMILKIMTTKYCVCTPRHHELRGHVRVQYHRYIMDPPVECIICIL